MDLSHSLSEHSKLLDKHLPADLVLADRGFPVEDTVGLLCAVAPPFIQVRKQLSHKVIKSAGEICHVSICVARLTGVSRKKYIPLGSACKLH